MFSPTVNRVRNGILQHVFEVEPPSEPHTNELDIFDPVTLNEDEAAVFYELQDLEEHLDTYVSSPFNPDAVQFVPCSEEPAPSDPHSALASLSPTDPETRHIMFRLRGLQNLLQELRAVVISHPSLMSQRDDLIATVKFEIEHIFSRLWDARRAQLSNPVTLLGVRRVPVVDYSFNPYASPLATSAIVLTAVIHAMMGVGRAHCNFILASLRAILSMAFKMQESRSVSFAQQHTAGIPLTLPTALYRLNLSPAFDLYTCCPKCSRIYIQPTDLGNQNQLLTTCTAKVFDGVECGAELSTTHHRGTRIWQKPLRRYTHMRFETWIGELLLRPGIEDLLETTHLRQNSGVAADVWDAPYLKTFPDPAQPSFMDGPPNELRLIMMLHFDFFNPFQMKQSGKLRSIGCFFMICLNLPSDIRYNASNAYLVSVVPGPAEPKLADLHHFIKPIVDDMIEIYAPGIWVSKTHKYPHGRRVRAGIAIKSMDIPAARGAGGFASHSHNCFCHLCTATRDQIDRTSLDAFPPRTIALHRQQVALWENAMTKDDQDRIYDRYGVRGSNWLRFPWWNPFASIVVGPMHWTKNVLEKQLRQNMAWSWTVPAGLPDNISHSIQAITTLEYEWGTRAFLGLDELGFRNAKLTAPLLRYLCRQRGIFEAGLSSQRLIDELNEWRKKYNMISADGSRSQYALDRFGSGDDITIARAHYYVSRHPAASHATVSQNSLVPDLRSLCTTLQLVSTGPKDELIRRLQQYYENTRVPDMDDVTPTKKSQTTVSILGFEILNEVKRDMERTTLPSWIKHPPINFGTVNHGKLQSEEFKSLALVSFTVTLVRLWGQNNDASLAPLRQRLDHFLHLMLAVRIVAFQSVTDSDISAFELHYKSYLDGLKPLYPSCSFTSVQHLGMHIPQFLRSLGPSTRYNESTCEQFVGMFQNISTNFKFGDLELTLHREFVMASRLRGMIECQTFTEPLGEFGEVIAKFIQENVPGLRHRSWQCKHTADPTTISESVYEALGNWSRAQSTRAFPRSLYICSKISLGNVVYAPYSSSTGDSCILFSPPAVTPVLLPGRIEFILEEPSHLVVAGKPRIMIIVRAFQPLTMEDCLYDPYFNHPIIGQNGAGIAQLYYDDVEGETHLIEPRDIVSHIAICPYSDTEKTLSRSAIVVLSLDLKHARFA